MDNTVAEESDVILEELIELDEGVNYYVLDGHKGESISSRCGRAIKRVSQREAEAFDWALLILAGVIQSMPWFGRNHCVDNIDPKFIGAT